MVSEIRIYVEGGGDNKSTKIALREGFDGFLGDLKARARQRRLGWRVVLGGGVDETIKDFQLAQRQHRTAMNILLVDSDGPVEATVLDHLAGKLARSSDVEEGQCHLMVQVMESWLIADVEALERFYGSGFQRSATPNVQDVERVTKADVLAGLEQATRRTSKGKYHKIMHGGKLLAKVRPREVQAKAAHCKRLFETLAEIITEERA